METGEAFAIERIRTAEGQTEKMCSNEGITTFLSSYNILTLGRQKHMIRTCCKSMHHPVSHEQKSLPRLFTGR